ncbi:MAG: hypothetical protein WAZ62_15220 [Zavarzinia sp.]
MRRATLFTRARSFFERLLGGGVSLGMPGPGLLPGQVQAAHQAVRARHAVAHAGALLDQTGDVDQVPGRPVAVALARRSLQDHGLDRRQFAFADRQRAALSPAIAQAFEAGLVVAGDPVPKRLAIHAGQTGRQGPAHAVQRIRDRQHSPCHPWVFLATGKAPQFSRRKVVSNPKAAHGFSFFAMLPLNQNSTIRGIPYESALHGTGTRGIRTKRKQITSRTRRFD